MLPARDEANERRRANMISARLWRISEGCKGMSGRMLRRLPVLAYARCLAGGTTRPVGSHNAFQHHEAKRPQLEPEGWLTALEAVILTESRNTEDS